MLTYDDIAAAPARINLPISDYSHSLQTGSDMRMPTFNGTQTYNHNGQPSDSDQD